MLPNGNMNRARGSVMVQNTTAFDIMMSIFACRSLDDEDFKTQLESSVSGDICEFIDNYLKDGLKPKTLRSRYQVELTFSASNCK